MHTSISKKIYHIIVAGGFSLFPLAVFAQGKFQNIIDLANSALDVIRIVVVIIFFLAILVFGWGIVKYITASGDPTKVKEARGFLFWGIIGIFVLASIFGLINFIGSAVGIDTTKPGDVISPPGVGN